MRTTRKSGGQPHFKNVVVRWTTRRSALITNPVYACYLEPCTIDFFFLIFPIEHLLASSCYKQRQSVMIDTPTTSLASGIVMHLLEQQYLIPFLSMIIALGVGGASKQNFTQLSPVYPGQL